MDSSGIDAIEVRTAELVATFALGQDNAFGQPMGSQLRSCLIATRLAAAMQLSSADQQAVYWVAQLRYVGCTGHAYEVAAVFGDDIDTRARSVVKDLSDPRELIPEIVRNAGSGQAGARRVWAVLSMLAGGRKYVEMNFRTGCEVGDVLLERLHMSDAVRDSLRYTFERWNGKGFPTGAKGASIPLPMRIVHVSQDVEALARIQGVDEAIDTITNRSGRTYDPDIVDAFRPLAREVFEQLDKVDPWDTALAAEPPPHIVLQGTDLDEALLVAADFIDLKSPFTAGHSRGVADLAAAAAEQLGMDHADVNAVRRAGWVHDFGRTAIPNSIWDKPAPVTRSELDRIEMHPLLTEQMLRRSSGLATLNPIAANHHEKLDGSGYSKGLTGGSLAPAARVLAAADCYHAMTEDRAHRPALSPTHAAVEVRRAISDGRLDAESAEAVLRAAGHESRGRKRTTFPAGLTEREVQVLRLAVQGLTVKQIAQRLVISAKTADHHIQHIYAKAGVSTRGAAALFAIEHDLVRPTPS